MYSKTDKVKRRQPCGLQKLKTLGLLWIEEISLSIQEINYYKFAQNIDKSTAINYIPHVTFINLDQSYGHCKH